MSGCKCAKRSTEFHGWACEVSGDSCMFINPNSKACAELFGEGPDAGGEKMTNKERYLKNIELEQLIAFTACGKMLSGKVKSIGNDNVMVETKNGMHFSVMKGDIAWIKTGERWPKGIYVELKRSAGDSDGRAE